MYCGIYIDLNPIMLSWAAPEASALFTCPILNQRRLEQPCLGPAVRLGPAIRFLSRNLVAAAVPLVS